MSRRPDRDPAPPSAEDCRRRAAEFRAKAARARTPGVRDQMLLMAADWENLARQAEAKAGP